MSNLRSDPTKLTAARSYLETAFPGFTISDRHDTDTISELFTIENPAQRLVYQVRMSRDFLDANSSEQIQQQLERWEAAEAARRSKRSLVVVTNAGVAEVV
jgi:hypothetical protein